MADVFAFVADFRNAPTWQSQLEAVRLDDGPFPAGRSVTEIHHFMGFRIETTGRLVAWEPLVGFTVQGRSGPMEAEARYSFAAQGANTRFDLTLTVTAHGLARLAEPVMRRPLARDLGRALVKLGQVLHD